MYIPKGNCKSFTIGMILPVYYLKLKKKNSSVKTYSVPCRQDGNLPEKKELISFHRGHYQGKQMSNKLPHVPPTLVSSSECKKKKMKKK
jgi:hypothetical protein